MGILNVTPDSFYDGGRFDDPGAALARAAELVEAGADLIDVGGESTRPGASAVSAEEEARRVLPVIDRVARELDVAISIDTMKAAIAALALDRGAHVVNDVSALADPAMPGVVASSGAGVVLMHMRGDPRTMQDAPRYANVVEEVRSFLLVRAEAALAAGIGAERIVVDPGIGFGKTFDHNWSLIARLEEIVTLPYPVAVGVSRKAFLGALLGGAPAAERQAPTLAASVAAVLHGASIVRLHEPAEARPHLAVADRIRYGERTGGHDRGRAP